MLFFGVFGADAIAAARRRSKEDIKKSAYRYAVRKA
jgi:hypothetical protein